MKIAIILIILILVFVFSAFQYLKYRLENKPNKRNLEADIDAEVSKFILHGLSPGMVVGVYKEGRSFIKGYGTTNKDAMMLPDATTIFQIGSVTKIFTASLLQTLCDEGVVTMDATLGELIGNSMPLSPSAEQVTLKQLVTHTSGFPKVPKSLLSRVKQMAGKDNLLVDPYSHIGSQSVFAYLETTEDQCKAGRFKYSNFGMGLLGHVLEIVTGKDYESLVVEKVLTPLGMTKTAITLTPDMKDRLAQGYTFKGQPTSIWTFASLAGAGAFSSNAEDMMKFIQSNVEEEGLNSRSFQKMRVPQCGGKTGIGWMQPHFVSRLFGNRNVVWHNGMVGGYASYLSIEAKSRAGVVILTNQAKIADMLGIMLTRLVRTQSWAAD